MLSTTWQLASPSVNGWRKGEKETDRQKDKDTKRETTYVSFMT